MQDCCIISYLWNYYWFCYNSVETLKFFSFTLIVCLNDQKTTDASDVTDSWYLLLTVVDPIRKARKSVRDVIVIEHPCKRERTIPDKLTPTQLIVPTQTNCWAPLGHLEFYRWLKGSWSFVMTNKRNYSKAYNIESLTACWRVSPIRSDIGCVSCSFGDKLLHACTITNMSSTPIPTNK